MQFTAHTPSGYTIGISAIGADFCLEAQFNGKNSDIISVNGVAELLDIEFALTEDYELREDLTEAEAEQAVQNVQEALQDAAVVSELENRLDEDRAEGEWG